MKRINPKLINSIFTAIISIVALWFIGTTLFLKLFGLSGYYVRTKSMEPTITQGSIVFVEKIDFDDITVGDVLTFQSADTTRRFTHRVVRIDSKNKLLYTRGDANNVDDPEPAKYERVLGKVKYSAPVAGYVVMAVTSRTGVIITASILIVWLSVEIEVFRLNKRRMKETDEKKDN